MEIRDTIIIAKDFADNPGARDRDDGSHSGQEFLENILLDRFNKAVDEKYLLLIDLDGVWGYPSSFIGGSFGRLAIARGSALLLTYLRFKSDKNPLRIEKIIDEIKNPTPPRK